MSKIKTRPVSSNRYETYKSTQVAKLETLRRKTVRREKYRGGAK